jgi:multiple sugar transport system ATP-binding protein
LRQLFQHDVVDGAGRVWFALPHGDDLLHAGSQPRGCFFNRYLRGIPFYSQLRFASPEPPRFPLGLGIDNKRMARLLIDRVSKTWPGGVRALDEVSLAVEEHELLVLVGPSGCGKTTLLRLIAGLEQPDAGRIILSGRDLSGVPPAQRDVALVFQNHALYPAKTVYENLAFALRLRRLPKAEIDDRVRQMAERLGLGDILNVRPGQLSGGQQQRVALGKALVRQPLLFLLDEPLSDLDAALRRQLRRQIKELQREPGTPTIHVTHDQEEAMSLADRLVVMNAGRVLQVGTPEGVYRRPACRFVAGFLGAPPMNFLEGALARRDGQLLFTGPTEAEWVLPPTVQDRVFSLAGQRVVLGVRPEALSLETPGAGALSLDGRVVLVETLGDRVDVTVQEKGARLMARLDARDAPAEGDRLRLFAGPEACHWFDAGPEGEAL